MGQRKKTFYEISYTKEADKFLRKHEDVRNQYENAIYELMFGEHPETIDVKRIKGKRNNYYRIRVGNVRIIYAIIHEKIIVIRTLLAGERGDVYKKMTGLQ